MTKLEKLLNATDDELDFYWEMTSNEELKKDIQELIAAYSDNGVIDRAIELLQFVRTKEN